MTKLLNDEITQQVQEAFAQLEHPVRVLFFKREEDCHFCEDAGKMVQEVTALSDKLSAQVIDLDQDAETAALYGVENAPTLILAGLEDDQVVDYGVRFTGAPNGNEFTSLIHDLINISKRDSGLLAETRAFLDELSDPVHLQVFVTPT